MICSMTPSLPSTRCSDAEPLKAICHRWPAVSFIRELPDEQRKWLSVARDSKRTGIDRLEASIADQLSSHLLRLCVVPASFIDHRTVIGALATVLGVAIPVAVYIGLSYGIYYYLVRHFCRLDAWLLSASAAVLVASVVAAQSGMDVAKCLVILILAPAIIVVGYEGRGYRYEEEALSPLVNEL
jgi:hypothetical protein